MYNLNWLWTEATLQISTKNSTSSLKRVELVSINKKLILYHNVQ